jgi:hypothetical protein
VTSVYDVRNPSPAVARREERACVARLEQLFAPDDPLLKLIDVRLDGEYPNTAIVVRWHRGSRMRQFEMDLWKGPLQQVAADGQEAGEFVWVQIIES